jgi:catechol 2,3-dioxygenase-like lactoylglutathione lyase family enzyme
MNKPPIEQQVTFLYTRDLVKTSHFYETVMGLPLVLDQGSCRIYQVSPDGFIGFCERGTTATGLPENIIYTFVTSHVDAWYEYLVARGVKFEKQPVLNPDYNIYHCFLRDPNGYLLEIQQFLDPAWPGQS